MTKQLRITIGDKTYDVTVEVLGEEPAAQPRPGAAPRASEPAPPPAARATAPTPPPAAGAGGVASPLAGVVVSLLVKKGDHVKQGQDLLVLEAMKMENRIPAHMAGKVKSLHVSEGQSVLEGHVLLVLE